mgnify:CR=1 FL=1|jgi:hypothetical protein
MLFRLIGLDLVRDLNLDAYKVQLIEICKKTQIVAQALPNYERIFKFQQNESGNRSYLPENIDKKLYQD